MTLLGFKDRFVPMVEAGYLERIFSHEALRQAPPGWNPWIGGHRPQPKRHSIRKGECGAFHIGRPIQLYRRVRQKDMRKIVDVDPVCTKKERIQISNIDGQCHVIIARQHPGDGALLPASVVSTQLSIKEVADLATADGFPNVTSFWVFFVPNAGDVFNGHIIHWDWL